MGTWVQLNGRIDIYRVVRGSPLDGRVEMGMYMSG